VIIECDQCEMRGIACGDCVVAVLLGEPGQAAGPAGAARGNQDLAVPDRQADLAVSDRQALSVLADAAMLPPLRFVRAGAKTREPGAAA
jgi:hypothetical protein